MSVQRTNDPICDSQLQLFAARRSRAQTRHQIDASEKRKKKKNKNGEEEGEDSSIWLARQSLENCAVQRNHLPLQEA